ncbi:MAG: chromosomal replication initiator DnaA [Sandarakinorhabdus sp.]|nr:chromosomal replication initiator DnaA [Sandarakinorhabdus sp.]
MGETVIAQPALPLVYQPRFSAADYFVSGANRAAVEWLKAPDNWPMPRCLVIGPPASGKTHLAGLFLARHDAVLIDDADVITDGELLFHAWNAASMDRVLLMTATRAPRLWAHGLQDFASRLAATPQIRLEDPDDALIGAVLIKCFADLGLRVGDDVIAWLVTRIERSFAAAVDIVRRLDGLALAERRDITVPLARVLLDAQGELAV